MPSNSLIRCSSHRCKTNSVETSPLSGLPVCQIHLNMHIQTVDEKVTLFQKLQSVMDLDNMHLLRAEQSSLAAELREVNDAFDKLQEQVEQWRKRTITRLQVAHDSVAERTRDAAEAEEFSKELSNARDWKKVMELTSSLLTRVGEAFERTEKFNQARTDLFSRQSKQQSVSDTASMFSSRSVGDVSSGVRNLQFLLGRHMAELMRQCWLDVDNLESADSDQSGQICQSGTTIYGLIGRPKCLTVCTNTAGFVGDSSNCVARAGSADSDCVPLPEPCIFVGCHAHRKLLDGSLEVDHIIATSLDGSLRLQCYIQCDFDWELGIHDLHCDSQKQLLYVVQSQLITVVDLSGVVQQIIDVEMFGNIEFCILDGNADELITNSDSLTFLTISKNDVVSKRHIESSSLRCTHLGSFAVDGKKIHVIYYVDNRIYAVCSISGQLLNAYPSAEYDVLEHWMPYNIAVDSRGLKFISCKNHVVCVLDCFGTVLQTLGTVNQAGDCEETFNMPDALRLIEMPGRRWLVVCDENNRRLRVFSVA
ncbi:hypothetical protein BOX15_Mlig012638g5 [Macrostomum lignano]|uniref:Uncharacterized protein n=1 Tax=Macrostomum lignano TaxID=282301 RepID=A0A267GMA4_9PLAT|nr:hypothetical protein BOX15_Mlig012638g5 [Macrostomum lignano]